MTWILWGFLLLLQQLTQTLSMRSRACGSYPYHVFAATLSNTVWFASQLILVDSFVKLLNNPSVTGALGLGLWYVGWCVFGSTFGIWLARRIEKRWEVHIG